VGPRPDRRFEVDAPYLVVLVKGKQFTITASYQGDSVAVTEGTVEVRTTAGGNAEGTLISAGQTASVAAGGGSLTVGSAQTSHGDGPASGKGGSEPQSQLPPLPDGEPQPPGGGDDGGGTGGGDDGHGGGGGEGGGGDQGGDDGAHSGSGGDREGGGDQGGDDGGHSGSGGDREGGGDQGGDDGGHSGSGGDREG